MLYRNESTKRKHVPGKKNFFQVGGGGGVGFFSNFRGGIDQEGGGSFFKGGLRGMLPSMVTLPLCHLHFQNMTLTLCQTKFSKL